MQYLLGISGLSSIPLYFRLMIDALASENSTSEDWFIELQSENRWLQGNIVKHQKVAYGSQSQDRVHSVKQLKFPAGRRTSEDFEDGNRIAPGYCNRYSKSLTTHMSSKSRYYSIILRSMWCKE